MSIPFIEENDQTLARREHLEALQQLVGNAYPNKFERSRVVDPEKEDTITAIVEKFRDLQSFKESPEELNKFVVRLAGRIASPPRVMGKVAFVHLSDGVSRLQIYVRKSDVAGVHNSADGGEVNGWDLFQLLDHGDFIGVEGFMFVTRMGELSVHVQKLQFLSKALLPLPDKMHGIQDPEIRQRQRYADLIAGSLKVEKDEALTAREVFERRAAVVRELRHILEDHGYIEVETPMLTPLATGAAARPFKTHHNALDIDLYARIAPELYLKRLLVGGFEKVYELNRNFRNEGIDRVHNPEFTMLEFYWAYADVNQMMDCCEELLRSVVKVATGGLTIRYGENEIDFEKPFRRVTMADSIMSELKSKWRIIEPDDFLSGVRNLLCAWEFINPATNLSINRLATDMSDDEFFTKASDEWKRARTLAVDNPQPHLKDSDWPQLLVETFEGLVEWNLIQPTFITDFPKAISPLSKAAPSDPSIAERFEFFVGAIETANGFSELNDPEEQYQRFKDQAQQRERGDEEAMVMDEDYIRALSYGMPPAAGIGVGIDRLTMLLANKHSIRDVILFPHMRPQKTGGSRQEADSNE